MSTSNGDLSAQLARIEGQLTELRNIVVGEDGEGGLRRDLKQLISLRDKGLGVLIILGLLATVAGSTIKEWFVHLFTGPNTPH